MSEVVKAIELVIKVGKVLKEAYDFSKECSKLRDHCDALQAFLQQNEKILRNQPIIAKLQSQLETIQAYLLNCKQRRFLRNPVFEVTFQKKIPKFRQELTDWTIAAILSINVQGGDALR